MYKNHSGDTAPKQAFKHLKKFQNSVSNKKTYKASGVGEILLKTLHSLNS